MKLRTTVLIATFAAALIAVALYAQTPPVTSASILQWDQSVAAGETILPPAYEFRLIVDGKPDVALKQTCTASTPTQYVCEGPLPLLATGGHTLVLFARVAVNGVNYAGGVSAPLPVISLLITVPQNLRTK